MIEKIGNSFEKRASKYDNPVTVCIGERELRVIRRFVPSGSSVLDYGCGTGRSALDHARRGCKVTAYDLSPKMLSFAENKAKQIAGSEIEFTSSLEKLFGRKWQVVTCIGVLDYYPDPKPLLIELRQYMETGGKLIVTIPNALSPLGWLYFILSRFTTPVVPRAPGFIRRAANDAGLRVSSLQFAFPNLVPFGHTLVVEMYALKQDN